MLAIARRNAIKEQLQEHKSVTITDLAARLNVTKETIRRDLRAMEEDGELIRTHGGAYILEGVQNDIDISTRQILIQPGDFIFLDGSTTAWFIARKIADRKLTVVTNSLEIANILSTSKTVHLVLIGGEFHSSSKSFGGDGAVRNLQQYFLDKAFISCRSVSMEFGITDTNDNDAVLHRIALDHAKLKYLVVDHSKLNSASFSSVCGLKELDGIIMDTDFSPEWKDCLNRNQVLIY